MTSNNATQQQAPPTPLDALKQELSDSQKQAAANDAAAAALKASITALQTAVQDVQKNLDQFAKEGPDLKARVGEDNDKYQQQVTGAIAALGGTEAAQPFADEWARFKVQQIDDVQTSITNDLKDVGPPGTKAQALADSQNDKAKKQAAYDSLKVANIKATLSQVEKILDDANKLSLLAGTAAGTYYLLDGQAKPLLDALNAIAFDQPGYQKQLVAAADDLAAAAKAVQTALGELDKAKATLDADQKKHAANHASLKQDTLDHLKNWSPPPPPKPAQQKHP